jgi:hypothetical protein
MNFLSRLFGGNAERVSLLEKRVAVLEHNVALMLRAIQGTNGALEKMAEALQAMDAEARKTYNKDNANGRTSKKEYIN